MNRAQALLAVGAAEQASADLELAIVHAPREIWAVRGISKCCFELSRFQEAITELTEFIGRGDGDAWALTMRGLCFGKMDETGSAMRDFSVALKLDPSSIWAYSCRGVAHLDQGKPEFAYTNSKQWIEMMWSCRA